MLVFAKVVELHSFSAAAHRLGMSRSAASKHVTRLEHTLGARLLNRTTRKLSLTEAGHSAYEHCARIASEVEASELSVQPYVSRPQGRLRVSAPSAFGRLHLVPIIPDYLAQTPGVSIDLVMSDRLVDLVDEQFDIAISSSPLTRANLVGRELAPIRWTVCASPAYVVRCRAPAKPSDLRAHNCIYYSSAAVRGDVWTFAQEGELISVRISGNFRANNSEAVRDAALGGLGIALLPTFAAWHDVRSGKLIPLLPEWQPHGTFGSTLIAYFIADRHLTPKIRTLVDFLVKRFGRTPYWDKGFLVGEHCSPAAMNIVQSRPGERKKKHELGTQERLS
jgi:DNA-binding transcriptional LysR family regulator